MDKIKMLINDNWKFKLSDEKEAFWKEFDDSSFKTVTIPHDWSVEYPLSREFSSGTGYVRGGCSPVGMKKQYKTIINQCAKDLDRDVVSGGKIGIQIEISPNDPHFFPLYVAPIASAASSNIGTPYFLQIGISASQSALSP